VLLALVRFEDHLGHGFGAVLPDDITMRLNASYGSGKSRDLLNEYDCRGAVSQKGFPLQAGRR
jgi:hypothetical protein